VYTVPEGLAVAWMIMRWVTPLAAHLAQNSEVVVDAPALLRGGSSLEESLDALEEIGADERRVPSGILLALEDGRAQGATGWGGTAGSPLARAVEHAEGAGLP
jgi:hypothetical protein